MVRANRQGGAVDLELQSLLNLQEKDLAAQEVENELAGLLI